MGYITYPRSGGSAKDVTRAQAAIVLIEQLLIHFNANDLNSLLALVARIGWANLPPALRARLWKLLYYDLFESIQARATADYNVSQKRMQALTRTLTAAALKSSDRYGLPLHQQMTVSADISVVLAPKSKHAAYHSEVLVFDNGMHAVLTADSSAEQYPGHVTSHLAAALRAHDASTREAIKTAHRTGTLVTLNLLADYVLPSSSQHGAIPRYDIAKIPQGLLSHGVVLLAILRALYPSRQMGRAVLQDQQVQIASSMRDAQQMQTSATVKKVLPYAGEALCLVLYDNLETSGGSSAALTQLTLHPQPTHLRTQLTVKIPLTDFTVSAVGTLWAIDRLGSMYCSKPELNGTPQDDELTPHSDELEWSVQSITSGTPACIVGQDDDLWIATEEGELLHYDGQSFSTFAGIMTPIRMKEVDGRYFLMGHNRQLLECIAGRWHSLTFAQTVPAGIAIDDVTHLNGELIAVSSQGLILRQQDDGLLTVLLDTPGIPWMGCDVLHGTLYLAGGTQGAYQLVGTSVISTQNNADILAVTTIGESLVYRLPTAPNPVVLRHTPGDDPRWMLVKT